MLIEAPMAVNADSADTTSDIRSTACPSNMKKEQNMSHKPEVSQRHSWIIPPRAVEVECFSICEHILKQWARGEVAESASVDLT